MSGTLATVPRVLIHAGNGCAFVLIGFVWGSVRVPRLGVIRLPGCPSRCPATAPNSRPSLHTQTGTQINKYLFAHIWADKNINKYIHKNKTIYMEVNKNVS